MSTSAAFYNHNISAFATAGGLEPQTEKIFFVGQQVCTSLCFMIDRVATVREKCLENETFPGQGKVRELCGWQGKFRKDMESQEKSQGI